MLTWVEMRTITGKHIPVAEQVAAEASELETNQCDKTII